MIENLKGVYEQVSYEGEFYIKLHHNTDNEAYPRHWHSCIEVVMPVEGEYTLEYGGNPITLQEGDILLISPTVLHSFEACPGMRYIFQAEIQAESQLRTFSSFLTMYYPGVYLSKKEGGLAYEVSYRCMKEIVGECEGKEEYYELAVFSKLLEMATAIRRNIPAPGDTLGVSNGKQKEYMDKFMDVCSFIAEHCTEDLSLEMVADRAGFSKYHFSRLFKKFTSVSYYRYLNQKRIETAERMLTHPEHSVTEVALSCGFNSLSSFIRMFKSIKGCTPSEYRALFDR